MSRKRATNLKCASLSALSYWPEAATRQNYKAATGRRTPSLECRGGSIRNLLWWSVLIGLAAIPITSFSQNGSNSDVSLLEIGRALNVAAVTRTQAEVKIVSYNIRWRGGDDLREMIQLLKTDPEIGGASIIGLQEVDRNRKRTRNLNTVKLIAEEMGQHYAWAAPPVTKSKNEEETGVAILSNYPLSEVTRIVLPHEGPGGRRRVAIGATITIGEKRLRVYSVHAETRISVNKKVGQLKAVLEDLARYPKDVAAIVLGDFNTWEPSAGKKVSHLFMGEQFSTPFPNNRKTFLRRILMIPITLKLDWIWLRGLQTSSYGIDEKIRLSDHWPMWTVVKIQNAN